MANRKLFNQPARQHNAPVHVRLHIHLFKNPRAVCVDGAHRHRQRSRFHCSFCRRRSGASLETRGRRAFRGQFVSRHIQIDCNSSRARRSHTCPAEDLANRLHQFFRRALLVMYPDAPAFNARTAKRCSGWKLRISTGICGYF